VSHCLTAAKCLRQFIYVIEPCDYKLFALHAAPSNTNNFMSFTSQPVSQVAANETSSSSD
jgi:hypothetical protein